MNNAATATARTASPVRKLTYSALFLALAMVLPFLTGQIPEIGSMLCPMHLPALLCGFMCGWPWGLAVGFISPLLRSMSGMPPIWIAIPMAFEMATYGAVFCTASCRKQAGASMPRSSPRWSRAALCGAL